MIAMESYRVYWGWLTTIFAAGVFLLLGAAVYLEPLIGDLTRLGGYSENAFGWRAPQERFDPPLFEKDSYDKYYDVVVFGDSFTFKSPGEQTDDGSYWQNFFVSRTGLSLAAFHLGHTKIEEIISSDIFLRKPPRLFIFEHIERDLVSAPKNIPTDKGRVGGCKLASTPKISPLKVLPQSIHPLPFNRKQVYQPSDNELFGLELTATANMVRKSFFRQILGLNNTDVINLKLTRDDLFSSSASSELLVYRKDTLKKDWSKKQMKEVQCSLIALQNIIQSNGKTSFILLIAPDKLTAYDTYLENKQYAGFGKISQLENPGLNMPKLEQQIKQEIVDGVKDIYMPNDTHWGVCGHKLAADVVINYLVKANQLIFPPTQNQKEGQ